MKIIWIYHMAAFVLGFILDQIVGDPYRLPHPIRAIGSLIGWLTDRLHSEDALEVDASDGQSGKVTADGEMTMAVATEEPFEVVESCAPVRNRGGEFAAGVVMALVVISVTGVISWAIVFGAYAVNVYAGIAVETVLTCYALAAKSLRVESMKVHKALVDGTLDDARKAVSMIVGRDTAVLDRDGVTKAAVETVAENTSDGVIAPLIYLFIGGPVLGLIYKAVNTMDSMVGYHSDRFEYFGKAAAGIDDVVNYIPARLSAFFMIAAAFVGGKDYSGAEAFRIFARDRYKHKSPNSAQTESACAGALGIRLAGDASYFGKIVKKPYIGDDTRPIQVSDIPRACKLMYITEYICVGLLMMIGAIVTFCVK